MDLLINLLCYPFVPIDSPMFTYLCIFIHSFFSFFIVSFYRVVRFGRDSNGCDATRYFFGCSFLFVALGGGLFVYFLLSFLFVTFLLNCFSFLLLFSLCGVGLWEGLRSLIIYLPFAFSEGACLTEKSFFFFIV